MKKCSACQVVLDESMFYKGYRNCKPCHLNIVSKYQKKNKKKIAIKDRRIKIKNKYGMSLEDYDRMVNKQKGKCKICFGSNIENKNSKNLYIDHCHITGIVRGLLCHRCNVTLGRIKDSKDWLESAIKYLP